MALSPPRRNDSIIIIFAHRLVNPIEITEAHMQEEGPHERDRTAEI
jgi:hypothetical protein